jgi:hypothetical protein
MIQTSNGVFINPAQITTINPRVSMTGVDIQLRTDLLRGSVFAMVPKSSAEMIITLEVTLSCGTKFEEGVAKYTPTDDAMVDAMAYITSRLPAAVNSNAEAARRVPQIMRDFTTSSPLIQKEITKWLS